MSCSYSIAVGRDFCNIKTTFFCMLQVDAGFLHVKNWPFTCCGGPFASCGRIGCKVTFSPDAETVATCSHDWSWLKLEWPWSIVGGVLDGFGVSSGIQVLHFSKTRFGFG